MSKFLKIIENSTPSQTTESKLKMVSTLVKLIDSISGIDVNIVDHNTFTISVNGETLTLDVRDIDNLNEQSSFDPTYNLDQAVNNAAAKALYKGPGSGMLGITTPQKANAAVKRRENVVKKAIPVYDKITKDLEQAISASVLRTGSNRYKGLPNPSSPTVI